MNTSRNHVLARGVILTVILLLAGRLPAFAGQPAAAIACDTAALNQTRAEFERLQTLRQSSPGAVSADALRAASSAYVLQSETCYHALYGGDSTTRIDDGGMWMDAAGGGAMALPFLTKGTKWGAGSPFTGGQDVTGPGIPGGTVSYSFMANGVSMGTHGDANVAITSLPGSTCGFTARITSAFAAWSAIANITFVQVNDNGATFDAAGAAGDIRIGSHTFDGPGSVLAHGFYPPPNGTTAAGDLHFDKQEAWACAPATGKFDIGIVALHEVGHTIGLDHEPTRLAVMNATYNAAMTTLQPDDIKGAGTIYNSVVLALVVDDTGSMSPEIGAVRQALTNTIARLKADTVTSGKPFPMTAIITFKDDVTTRIISDDPAKLQPVVDALVASGGGDCPEASNAALIVAGNLLNPQGVAMLITDADSRPDGPSRADVLNVYLPKSLRLSVLLSGSCTEFLGVGAVGSAPVSYSRPSDNHDPASQSAAPRDQRLRAGGLDASGPVLGAESSVRTFTELTAETRGTFTAIPEIKTSSDADAKTKYTNVGTNLAVSAVLPAVSLVLPAAVPRGVAMSVEVTGANSNFQNSSSVSVSGAGVTVLSKTVLSPTRLLVSVVVDVGAATGFRDITVTTSLGGGTTETAVGVGSLQVTVPPTTATIAGIVPSQVAQGATKNVTITGINTHFASTTTVSLGAGVTVNSVSVTSATELTANVTVSGTAAVGYRDVSATTGFEFATEDVVGPLLVTAPPPIIPRILTATPASGARGKGSMSVTLAAENTHFTAATTIALSGPGITVNSVTVTSATSLVAVITIAADATLGFRDIIVTTGSEAAVLLEGFNVVVTAIGKDDLVIDFGAFGAWTLYNNGSFSLLHTASPEEMATGDMDGDGKAEVILDFPGFGIWVRKNNTSWVQLHPANAAAIATGDLDGNGLADVLVDFPGFGLWAYMNNTTWTRLHPVSPTKIAIGDLDGNGKDEVILNFTGFGVWVFANNTGFYQLHTANVSAMVTGDLDGNGKDEVILSFPGFGVWAFVNNAGFAQLHTSNPDQMVTGDLDGNGKSDVVMSFPGFGIWAFMNNTGYSQVHIGNPAMMTTGDLDGNGKSDLVISFTGFGLWAFMNNAVFVQLHTVNPQGMVTGNVDGL